MKVREFIEVFKNIKIEAPCKTYSGSKVIEEKFVEFGLANFNISSYGYILSGTFEFVKNGSLVGSFSSLHKLTLNSEIMDMELISVEKLHISHYKNLSSSGNKYYDNSCNLRFVVK